MKLGRIQEHEHEGRKLYFLPDLKFSHPYPPEQTNEPLDGLQLQHGAFCNHMTQAIATVTAAVIAFVAIALGAWTMQPQHKAAVRLEQIRTDSTTHYATLASVGRCNFVEMTR